MTTPPHPHFVAQTAEQARLLLNTSYAPALGALMHGEASAGEVASAAEITVKQAHHRLTRLLSTGLIDIEGERKRGGRPVKVYRALADVYRVPFELTEAATVSELTLSMMHPYFAAFVKMVGQRFEQDADRDFLVGLNAQGQFGINLEGSRTHQGTGLRGAYGTFLEVRLGQEAREEAERRIRGLHAWLMDQGEQSSGQPDAQDCIAGLLFTPGGLEKR